VTDAALVVRPIDAATHAAYLRLLPAASFLQTPAWGQVKTEWRAESLGWFAGDRLVGAGLVLHRSIPRIGRTLAYLPEGPALDWAGAARSGSLASWLDPMVSYLKAANAFAIRMGPPVPVRRWNAATVKAAVADSTVRRLGDVPADVSELTGQAVLGQLHAAGWRQQSAAGGGFAAGQPQYVFQVPLTDRDDATLLAGMNQLWRRNIKRAAKEGVQVRTGGRADLPSFHTLYVETAGRDGFTPRPLAYFEGMWDALTAEDSDRIRLYLADHGGDLVAATTLVRVGQHAWYSYGASSTAKREVRGSNAVQWQMMRDARAAGATVYDLRGITDTLDADDPHIGLVQFKVGTGGQAVELAGEWDLPLNRALYRAFDLYLRRR
jgi:lipid II:glycine glycyltransferase (peptidoglycan interpeptide bridge formation enzyme)